MSSKRNVTIVLEGDALMRGLLTLPDGPRPAAGWPLVSGAIAEVLGPAAGDAVAQFSFVTHFETAQRGVLELRGLFFFFGFIALCVTLNTLFISQRRGST